VTGRRALEQRRERLSEIRAILRGMRNLSYLQVRRLTQLIDNQRAGVAAIEAAAADFLAWEPGVLPVAGRGDAVILAVGTERGFVGDLNERLLRALQAGARQDEGRAAAIVAVGRKLAGRLRGSPRLAAVVDGASVVEEVAAVVAQVVAELERLRRGRALPSLTALFTEADAGNVCRRRLLPPFETARDRPPAHAFAPLRYLPPERLLLELSDHFLLAALHAVAYEALLAESRRRVRHLEAAGRHLDDRVEALDRRLRGLRQEAIIEEIEVILLSATGPDAESSESDAYGARLGSGRRGGWDRRSRDSGAEAHSQGGGPGVRRKQTTVRWTVVPPNGLA
jgi:F-type H+-transporting ATPase subunit gamma